MADERIASPVRTFLSRSFSGKTFRDEADIFALGFGNSLFAMQLVAFVEGEFGIEIDSEDLEMENFCSVQAISGLVERKLAAPASD